MWVQREVVQLDRFCWRHFGDREVTRQVEAGEQELPGSTLLKAGSERARSFVSLKAEVRPWSGLLLLMRRCYSILNQHSCELAFDLLALRQSLPRRAIC